MWPRLVDVSCKLRQPHVLTGVTTNGRILCGNRFNIDDIVRGFDELTISIDGWRVSHDVSRGVPGLYEGVMRKLAEIRLAGMVGEQPKLRVNILVDRSSLGTVDSIVTDCVHAGVNEVTFNALWADDSHHLNSRKLTPGDLDKLVTQIQELRVRFGNTCKILGSSRYFARLRQYASGQHVSVGYCSPGERTLFVDSAGRIAPCAYTGSTYGVPIANVASPEDIDRMIGQLHDRKRNNMAAACFDCPDTNLFGKFET